MAYGVAPFRNFPVGLCSPLALAFMLAAWDPARPEGALVAPRYVLVSLQPPNFEVQTRIPSAEFRVSARAWPRPWVRAAAGHGCDRLTDPRPMQRSVETGALGTSRHAARFRSTDWRSS